MWWKCCTQYASKFGKLNGGHKTGKDQFSFQSKRNAMPKNAQTTAQLLSSHMLASMKLKRWEGEGDHQDLADQPHLWWGWLTFHTWSRREPRGDPHHRPATLVRERAGLGTPASCVGDSRQALASTHLVDRLLTPVFLGFPVAQLIKNLPAMQETWVGFLGWENPLENGKATHSSILALRIPWSV